MPNLNELQSKMLEIEAQFKVMQAVIPALMDARDALFHLAVDLCRNEADVKRVTEWAAKYAPGMIAKETKQ